MEALIHLIVKTDRKYNDQIIIQGKDGPIPIWIDTRWNPHQYLKIWAEVVAVPSKWGDHVAYEVYEGHPTPNQYNEGVPTDRTPRTQADINILKRLYKPAIHEPVFRRFSELPIDIFVGDTVYFNWSCLDDVNFIMERDGEMYFKVPYYYILAVKRTDGSEVNTVMPNERVLALPIKEQRNTSLIIPEIADRESKQIAQISHIGNPLYLDTGCKNGDIILFSPHSDFPCEMDGIKYWAFRQQDIIAVKKEDWLPVSDYVKIKPTERRKRSEILSLEYNSNKHNEGIIESVGKSVTELRPGDKVIYQPLSATAMEFDNHYFVKEQDVFLKYEQSNNT